MDDEKKVMIPVIQFGGMRPPRIRGPGEELSRRMGEGFSEAMGDEAIRADLVLEVLAVWVTALIKVHPSCQEYLEGFFMETLANSLSEGNSIQ
jgi:hypothetical protein